MSQMTLGADPEFMLCKDGEIHSAIGIIQGDIDNRINIKGHQFYWDNVMAECAVRPESRKEKVLISFKECFQISDGCFISEFFRAPKHIMPFLARVVFMLCKTCFQS